MLEWQWMTQYLWNYFHITAMHFELCPRNNSLASKATDCRKRMVIAWYDGRKRSWTVERFNLDHGQLKDLISDRSRWRQDSKWECMSETSWKQQKTKEWRISSLHGLLDLSYSFSIYSFHLLCVCLLSVSLFPSLSFVEFVGLFFFLFDNSLTFWCIRSILPCLSGFFPCCHTVPSATLHGPYLLPDGVDYRLTYTSSYLFQCVQLSSAFLSIISLVIHGLRGKVLCLRPTVSVATNITASLKSFHLTSG